MDWYAEPASGGGTRRSLRTSGAVVKLTPAEAAVAAAAAQGLSNKEIAQLLNKQAGTVAKQLSTIYRKLTIRSRAHLIMMMRN